MKKTRLVALGLGALSIAGLVGAGVGLSVNNNVRTDEVKADRSISGVIPNPGSSLSTMRLWIVCDNNTQYSF